MGNNDQNGQKDLFVQNDVNYKTKHLSMLIIIFSKLLKDCIFFEKNIFKLTFI